MLTWSAECFISSNATADQEATFAIFDRKSCIPIATLSIQDSEKLLQHLK